MGYRRKPHAGRYPPWKIAVIILCVLCIAVSAVKCFSDSNDPKYTVIDGRDYYAVSLGVYADESGAASAAEYARGRGGGGYAAYDGNYSVLLACYGAKTEAESVIRELKNGGTHAVLYIITVPKIKVLTPLAPALNNYGYVYRFLYDASVKADTGEAVNLKSLITELSARASALTEGAEMTVTHIKAHYILTINLLSAALPLTAQAAYFRYLYLRILYEYIALFRELA